jgi:hypothetical protein
MAPSGLNTTCRGLVPTVMSARTVPAAVSMTATTSEPPAPVSPPVTVA